MDELSDKNEALNSILSSLRTSDDESIRELVQLARNDRPIEEIVDLARSHLRRNELRSKSRARLRHAMLSIASLTDEPPIRVPSYPWTEVINDDAAISHLISVYFAWHHCAYPAVDQDLFVREMNSKDLSSQFCSPFLVNALLLVACVGPVLLRFCSYKPE